MTNVFSMKPVKGWMKAAVKSLALANFFEMNRRAAELLQEVEAWT